MPSTPDPDRHTAAAAATADHMLFDVRDGVARLTVNRPEQRNAMTWAMYQRLVEVCEEVTTTGFACSS